MAEADILAYSDHLLITWQPAALDLGGCISLLGWAEQTPQARGKEQKCISPQFWRLEVWDQDVSRVGFL